jgi:hypothetical protein
MAIAKDQLPQYLQDWNSIQLKTSYGYAAKALEILNNQLVEGQKPYTKAHVHNVVSGVTKDRKILNAIMEVVLEKQEISVFVSPKNLNLIKK